VLFVTWKNTRYNSLGSGTLRGDNVKTLLSTLLLREGFLYFICLAALNVAQLVVYVAMDGNSYIYSLLSALTAIFVSRFLLNLRQVDEGSLTTDSQDPYSASTGSQVSTVRFMSSFVGSMGAPLDGSFGIDQAAPYHRSVNDAEQECEHGVQLSRREDGNGERNLHCA